MIVDAHAHVWSSDPERYPWHPTFGYVPRTPATPQALLARMDALGIQLALLVQPSVYGDDHRFLLDTVAAHPTRFVPVGQVDPTEPASVGNGRDLVAGAGLVGLRVIFARDATRAVGQASAPAWDELATLGVPICLRVMPEHHQLAIGLIRAYPTVPFVIDHLGLPERPSSRAAAARLAELAQRAARARHGGRRPRRPPLPEPGRPAHHHGAHSCSAVGPARAGEPGRWVGARASRGHRDRAWLSTAAFVSRASIRAPAG